MRCTFKIILELKCYQYHGATHLDWDKVINLLKGAAHRNMDSKRNKKMLKGAAHRNIFSKLQTTWCYASELPKTKHPAFNLSKAGYF